MTDAEFEINMEGECAPDIELSSSSWPNCGETVPADLVRIWGSVDIYGCMDKCACNYDQDATIDDGSCEYSSFTMPTALNCDLTVAIDSGSSSFPDCLPAYDEPGGTAEIIGPDCRQPWFEVVEDRPDERLVVRAPSGPEEVLPMQLNLTPDEQLALQDTSKCDYGYIYRSFDNRWYEAPPGQCFNQDGECYNPVWDEPCKAFTKAAAEEQERLRVEAESVAAADQERLQAAADDGSCNYSCSASFGTNYTVVFGIVLFILAGIATTRYFTKNKYVMNGMRIASAMSSGLMASYWFDCGLCASGLYAMGGLLTCEAGLYMGDYFYVSE